MEMSSGRGWLTDDPLGLGSLLSDAYSVAQLMTKGYFLSNNLLLMLLDVAAEGLEAFVAQGSLEDSAEYRLPFRETGLSIGLEAIKRLSVFIKENPTIFERLPEIEQGIKALSPHITLAETIEKYWLEPEHQKVKTWTDHRDINMVMLATSLSPDGYLKLF